MEEDKLAGIITDGDLKRHMRDDLLSRQAKEIMTTNPKHIAQDALAVQAMDLMLNAFDNPISSLIVVDSEENEALVGLIRLNDCLKAGIA